MQTRTLKIITPENIPLELELAGLGLRFGALFIDLLVLGTFFIVLWFFGAILIGILQTVGQSDVAIAALVIASFVCLFGYFILFEALWNGQTPGKRYLGLRVIQDTGFPVTFFQVANRNLVRIADLLPGFFGVGAIAVFCHQQHKRLGDVVAGTVVIKERSASVLSHGPLGPPRTQAAYLANARLATNVTDPRTVLTEPELNLMRRFALRRWEMDPQDAEQFAYRLLGPMVGKLNLRFVPGQPPRYADIISVIIRIVDGIEENEWLAIRRDPPKASTAAAPPPVAPAVRVAAVPPVRGGS